MYVGVNNYSTIELRFRVVCSEDYYGPNCTTFCTPMDNLQGHFSCDQNGTIVCNPGYTNTMTNCVECVPAEGCCELPYAANSVVPVHAIMAVEYQQFLARLCQLFSQTHSVTIKWQCLVYALWIPCWLPKSNMHASLPAAGQGYCTQPGECLCSEGYTGSLCETGTGIIIVICNGIYTKFICYSSLHIDINNIGICNCFLAHGSEKSVMVINYKMWFITIKYCKSVARITVITDVQVTFLQFADLDPCGHTRPCQNGGTCTNIEGAFNCQCPIEYEVSNFSKHTGRSSWS